MKPPNLKQKIVHLIFRTLIKASRPESSFLLVNYPGETKNDSRVVGVIQGKSLDVLNNLSEASRNDQAFNQTLELYHQRRKIEEQIAFQIALTKNKINETFS